MTSQASPRDRVTGPGALLPDSSGLSPGDTYAEYQWGLKNDGSLQLVEIRSQFADSGDAYETPDGERGPHSGLPIPYGPGGYQVYTTDAAAGVDINIEPAWELYDASQTNRDVVVAVIDTGADILHPDLRDSIWANGGEIPG